MSETASQMPAPPPETTEDTLRKGCRGCVIGCLVMLGFFILFIVLLNVGDSLVQIIDWTTATKQEIVAVPGQPAVIALGDSSNSPRLHFVWIESLGLWFGETEVTIEQFRCYERKAGILPFLGLNRKSDTFTVWPAYRPSWPAMLVTDGDSEMFCKWLNRRCKLPDNYTVRLPTCSEWEFVASDGEKSDYIYPWGSEWPPRPMADGVYPNLWGEDLTRDGGYQAAYILYKGDHRIPGYRDGHEGPAPVLKSGRNPLGLYGLAGNIAEWCYVDSAKSGFVLKGWDYGDFCFPSNLTVKHNREFSYIKDPFTHATSHGDYRTGFRIIIAKPLPAPPIE